MTSKKTSLNLSWVLYIGTALGLFIGVSADQFFLTLFASFGSLTPWIAFVFAAFVAMVVIVGIVHLSKRISIKKVGAIALPTFKVDRTMANAFPNLSLRQRLLQRLRRTKRGQ